MIYDDIRTDDNSYKRLMRLYPVKQCSNYIEAKYAGPLGTTAPTVRTIPGLQGAAVGPPLFVHRP